MANRNCCPPSRMQCPPGRRMPGPRSMAPMRMPYRPPTPTSCPYERSFAPPQNDCYDDEDDDEDMDDDDEAESCPLPENICPLPASRSSASNPFKTSSPEQEELKAYEAKITQELIRDNYCPGTIQDTTNKVVDFNKKAFTLALKGDQIRRELPSPEPITLIEAFIRRFKYDKKMIFKEQIENVNNDGSAEVVNEQMRLVDDYFKTQHNTEVTRALKSFIKADKIYSISQSSKDSKPFDLELYNGVLNRENVEIKVFSGNTKPNEGGQ